MHIILYGSASVKAEFVLYLVLILLTKFRMSSSMTDDQIKMSGLVATSEHIVIITGAGISAASGLPTFRGAGGLWRKYESEKLATPEAFKQFPSLVWEFYHYRRELVLSTKPNQAHIAIAKFEKRLKKQGLNRTLTVITQNVDGLHAAAGSENVIEMHGSLFKTRCLKCKRIVENRDSPICKALEGRGDPDLEKDKPVIPKEDLPRCKKSGCNGLLRPHIIWFGERLEDDVVNRAEEALEKCDLCLVVGTSSTVVPVANYAKDLVKRKVTVAEFNQNDTLLSPKVKLHFKGPCEKTLPFALDVHFVDKS